MKNTMRAGNRHRGSGFGVLYTFVLLWLAGAGLRITVLAIPPIIPQLHDDLQLSQTDIGILSGLPSLLFACAAIPGAALIARFGVLRVLLCGLLLTAVAGALRGLAPDVMTLFAMTFLMGLGIAVMQPAMPPVVRRWLPQRIGFGTALYANGMLLGETFAASLTLPLVLPLVGGSWRWSLVFWSLPVLLAAILVALRMEAASAPTHSQASGTTNMTRWWPDWRDPLVWKVGLIMGSASSIYFGTNAFLPDFLARSGRSDLIAEALTVLNASQVVATVTLLFFAQRLQLRRLPFVASGVTLAISVGGLVVMPGAWALPWCALIGLCCAYTLTLSLSVPALVAPTHDVHRLSAALFTIGYACAFVVPAVGGAVWDATGIAAVAFVPAAFCGMLIVLLAARLQFRQRGTTGRAEPAAGCDGR